MKLIGEINACHNTNGTRFSAAKAHFEAQAGEKIPIGEMCGNVPVNVRVPAETDVATITLTGLADWVIADGSSHLQYVGDEYQVEIRIDPNCTWVGNTTSLTLLSRDKWVDGPSHHDANGSHTPKVRESLELHFEAVLENS